MMLGKVQSIQTRFHYADTPFEGAILERKDPDMYLPFRQECQKAIEVSRTKYVLESVPSQIHKGTWRADKFYLLPVVDVVRRVRVRLHVVRGEVFRPGFAVGADGDAELRLANGLAE